MVLHTMVLWLQLLSVIALVISLFVYIRTFVNSLIFLAIFFVLLCIGVIARSGRIRVASFLYVFLLWITATLVVYFGTGIRSPHLALYIAISVTTGIFFGVKWAILLSIFDSAVVLLFAILENSGYSFPRFFPEPAIARWFDFTLYIAFTLMPLFLALTGLKEALTRARNENEQRQKAEELLRESERKYRDIANNVPGMVFQFRVPGDRAPYFSYLSPRGIDIFDFQVDPAIQRYVLGSNMHPDDREGFLASINAAIDNRSHWNYEGRIVNRRGESVWIRGYATLTRNADELVFDGILLDITDRKRLEAQVLEMQKMEAVGRLSGGIAHDFNNILVPIIGYVELAMADLPPESRTRENLGYVREAAQRAALLTRQILAFGRRQVLAVRVINLNDVITGFRHMIDRIIEENIAFELFLNADLHPVKADRGQIEQVLLNLAVNARDAMPNGGKLSIATSNIIIGDPGSMDEPELPGPGAYALLAVSDTGSGMDTSTKQRAFEPFFSTKKKEGRTGLGLPTVFGIIKQHGGGIRVSSEPGMGTTISVYLPQVVAAVNSPVSDAERPSQDRGPGTVLVVEDDDSVRRLAVHLLTEHGYNVIEAKDGNEGLERLARHANAIDLMLTDVILPEMNGRELYTKAIGIRPALKVVYMSGYTDNIIAHHGILDEGIHFLPKPFSVTSLVGKIREALGEVPL